MAKILLVEDEPALSSAIKEWLADEFHLVEIAESGDQALELLAKTSYDLILLDWMLPNLSGVEICKQYRAGGGIAPVLMLTAKKSLLAKETGLDSGADDYLTKPFHLRELSARVRALLRRPSQVAASVLELAGIRLDRSNLSVQKGTELLHLQPKEFALLELLMRNPGKPLSTESILDLIWGTNTEVSAETLRSNIKTLRRKIDTEGQPSIIVTVHGIGYKIEDLPTN
ncbi:MAG: response regulator transcription factor [Candidatus Obscuribacterales bacterium]|nr:response regulator transcription factor [Candidatus Obscuribacterales bacterium]